MNMRQMQTRKRDIVSKSHTHPLTKHSTTEKNIKDKLHPKYIYRFNFNLVMQRVACIRVT